MAQTVTRFAQDRVRTRHWAAQNVDLVTVADKLQELIAELAAQDTNDEDHPHTRNCVLNLVVALGEGHRADEVDRMIGGIAVSHPLRAILIHLGGGEGDGTIDAEITAEAHQLVTGCPVQRQQVLLHVRGGAVEHLASLVEPLLMGDVPTYVWWARTDEPDLARMREASSFTDVFVVDSAQLRRPAEVLLQLAALVAEPDTSLAIADFRWERLRPWQEAIAQFFAPQDRRHLLAGVREVEAEAVGLGPQARVGGALIAGWAAAALGWRFATPLTNADTHTTTVVAESPTGHAVQLVIKTVRNDRLHPGDLLRLCLRARAGRRECEFTIERDETGESHATVTMEITGGQTVRQGLPLPLAGDADLLIRVLWEAEQDELLVRAIRAAAPLLETLR